MRHDRHRLWARRHPLFQIGEIREKQVRLDAQDRVRVRVAELDERDVETGPPLGNGEGLHVDLERAGRRGGQELAVEVRGVAVRRRELVLERRVEEERENVSPMRYVPYLLARIS